MASAAEDESGGTTAASADRRHLPKRSGTPDQSPDRRRWRRPRSDLEHATLEQIDEALKRYPAPGPDQAASREYKALVEARAAIREEQTWLNQRRQLESKLGAPKRNWRNSLLRWNRLRSLPPRISPAISMRSNSCWPSTGQNWPKPNHDSKCSGTSCRASRKIALRGVNRTNELEIILRDLDVESSTDEVDTLLLRARRQSAEAELALVKLSVSSTDSLRSLIASEQTLVRAQIANLETLVAAETARTAEQRRLELEEQQEKAGRAMRMAALQDPELQKLAEENQAWLDERREIEAERAEMEDRTKLYESEAASIRSALESIKRRLGITGNSPAIGS